MAYALAPFLKDNALEVQFRDATDSVIAIHVFPLLREKDISDVRQHLRDYYRESDLCGNFSSHVNFENPNQTVVELTFHKNYAQRVESDLQALADIYKTPVPA